jgi:ABC-type nickel/cobalt efflux system permease component RcnA
MARPYFESDHFIGGGSVAGVLAGVTVTLIAFAVTAAVARERFMTLLERTAALRQRLGWSLELAGAAAVLLLGMAMLMRHLPD